MQGTEFSPQVEWVQEQALSWGFPYGARPSAAPGLQHGHSVDFRAAELREKKRVWLKLTSDNLLQQQQKTKPGKAPDKTYE